MRIDMNIDQLNACDARAPLHLPAVSDAVLPRPAIRPYPSQYVSSWRRLGGMHFTVRPIRSDDETLLVDFHMQLSEKSVYLRFFVPLKVHDLVAHQGLFAEGFVDYDREIALVAEYAGNAQRHLAGIARMVRNHSDNSVEVAFLVADKFQNRGLGTYFLDRTIYIAREEGIATLQASLLAENLNMRHLLVRAGFCLSAPDEGVITARLRVQ
jgi:acetyltransferase